MHDEHLQSFRIRLLPRRFVCTLVCLRACPYICLHMSIDRSTRQHARLICRYMPWLIEVNSSPAVDYSTAVTERYDSAALAEHHTPSPNFARRPSTRVGHVSRTLYCELTNYSNWLSGRFSLNKIQQECRAAPQWRADITKCASPRSHAKGQGSSRSA